MSFCAPRHKGSKKTCFSQNSLIKIAKAFNKKYSKKKVKISKNKNMLLENIKNNFPNFFKNEWCLLNKNFIKSLNDDEINDTFRPEKPKEWLKNERDWLSTVDIEKVLSQYENKYNDFITIGPVPIDFDKRDIRGNCTIDELCNLKLKDLLKDKLYKLGIVFNLDKHDEPGSHWVALYGDLKKNDIYYFDSYGLEPPNEIEIFMNRMQEEGKKLNRNIDLYYNDIRHQFKNSECGVYCLNFIIQFLEGKNFKEIIENVIFDDDMNSMRNVYYRPRCS